MFSKKTKKLMILSCVTVLGLSMLAGCKKSGGDITGQTADNKKPGKKESYSLYEKYGKTSYNPSDYVQLGEYKNLEVYQVKTEITDDMIEEEMDYILSDYVEYQEVTERGIENGDYVTVSYTAKVDGQENEDLAYEDYDFVVGEESIYPEFEKAIMGKMSGDKVSLSMELTEDYFDEYYVGMVADYDISISSVMEVSNEPEWTDDFVAEISDCKTIDEYKEQVKADLTAQYDLDNRDSMIYDLWDEIMITTVINGTPDGLEDEYSAQVADELESAAEEWGLSKEEYLEYFIGETEDEYIQEMLQNALVEQAIMQAEDIKVSDKEFEQILEENLDAIGVESVKEAYDFYDESTLYTYCMETKLYDFLADNAKITFVSEDEYYSLYYGDEEGDFDEEEILDTDDAEDTDAELIEE